MLNFQSILRGLSTNFAAISADADDPALRPFESKRSPTELADRVEAWAKTTSTWKVQSKSDQGDVVTMHLTRTTRVFRFTDDIHVTIQPTIVGSILTATSQSRVGKGDLGQNPRNLKEMLKGIR